MLRMLARVLMPLLMLALAACGGAEAAPTLVPPTDIVPTATPPVNPAGQALAARVNGTEILVTTLEREMLRQAAILNPADQDAMREAVLTQLIEEALIVQGAAAQGVTISDAELQTELQNNQILAGSPDNWTNWLNANGYTAAEYAETLRIALLTNRIRDSLVADLNGTVLQAHARHILLRTEPEAQDVLQRLQKGEDFAALATVLSKDETTRVNGGDLGWFTVDELFVPQVAQAVFQLQNGQVAGPVASELGYHIVQLLELSALAVDPERQVLITQTRFEAWLEILYQQANIERFI